MNTNPTHADMVRGLTKTGEAILSTMTPEQAYLLHMAVGISGEAGELLDAVKKHAIYNKPLDLVNVVEELGDIEYYLEGLRQKLGIFRQTTLDENVTKLGKRYPNFHYTDAAAQARADKQ